MGKGKGKGKGKAKKNRRARVDVDGHSVAIIPPWLSEDRNEAERWHVVCPNKHVHGKACSISRSINKDMWLGPNGTRAFCGVWIAHAFEPGGNHRKWKPSKQQMRQYLADRGLA